MIVWKALRQRLVNPLEPMDTICGEARESSSRGIITTPHFPMIDSRLQQFPNKPPKGTAVQRRFPTTRIRLQIPEHQKRGERWENLKVSSPIITSLLLFLSFFLGSPFRKHSPPQKIGWDVFVSFRLESRGYISAFPEIKYCFFRFCLNVCPSLIEQREDVLARLGLVCLVVLSGHSNMPSLITVPAAVYRYNKKWKMFVNLVLAARLGHPTGLVRALKYFELHSETGKNALNLDVEFLWLRDVRAFVGKGSQSHHALFLIPPQPPP